MKGQRLRNNTAQYNVEHRNGWCYPVNVLEHVEANTAAEAKAELERRWKSDSVERIQLVKYNGEYTGWY